MQFGDQLTLPVLISLLVIMFILIAIYHLSSRTTQITTKPTDHDKIEYPSVFETKCPDTDNPHEILAWIECQKEKAEALAEKGELHKATERFSSLLEHVYREMVKLSSLGPQRSSDLKKQLEYTRDKYAAKASLDDLNQLVQTVDDLSEDDSNLWSTTSADDYLDDMCKKGLSLADDAYGLAESRSLSDILEETRQLRKQFIDRMKAARTRLRGSKSGL